VDGEGVQHLTVLCGLNKCHNECASERAYEWTVQPDDTIATASRWMENVYSTTLCCGWIA
jgi:hypothetical protein